MIGEVVGSYKIERLLGAGGMGAVFLATHTALGRKAAVKFLLPEYSANESAVARFFQEARAAASLHHAGIVDVYDLGQHQGRAFIVMAYLEGESLAGRLQRVGRLGERESLTIAREIASAIGAAHDAGMVHRDLKPDNVFLTPDPAVPSGERVKVLDFGVAKLAQAGDTPAVRTRSGVLIGTPIYMAPEQCRGAGKVDHRADVYSLGVLLFEALAGRPPFIGEGAGDLITQHLLEAPPTLALLGVVASDSTEKLLAWLLQKDPQRRPQTMSAVVEAIGAGSAPSVPPLAVTRSAEVSAVTPMAAASESATSAGSRMPLAVGALAAVVLAVGGAVLWTRGVSPPPPAEPVSAVQPAPAPPASSAQPPAAPAPEPRPAAPPSAPPGPAAKPLEAPRRAEPRRKAEKATTVEAPPKVTGTGFLSVTARPWAQVYLDGKLLQQTPFMRREVPAGRHVVDLVNDELGVRRRKVIEVTTGAEVRVSERLSD